MTDLQIRTLIATHTVWVVEDRGPRIHELAALVKRPPVSVVHAIAVLTRERLLTQDWRRGHRVRYSLRLTPRAVAFLEEYGEWPEP